MADKADRLGSLVFGTALAFLPFVARSGSAAPAEGWIPREQRNVCMRVCTMRDSFACCGEARPKLVRDLHRPTCMTAQPTKVGKAVRTCR